MKNVQLQLNAIEHFHPETQDTKRAPELLLHFIKTQRLWNPPLSVP